MKTLILFLAISFSALTLHATQGYEDAMTKALTTKQSAQSQADFQAAANQFQMIANMAKDQWLPLYHNAHCYISISFMETEAVKKDAWLDQAETVINQLIELAPQEAEVYVLQAMMYTARLTVDPASRGQQYMALSSQANGRALAMDPTNPRARYWGLSNEIGMAQFFGNDTSKQCAAAQELLADWDNYESPSAIHPQWGKSQVQGMISNCK